MLRRSCSGGVNMNDGLGEDDVIMVGFLGWFPFPLVIDLVVLIK